MLYEVLEGTLSEIEGNVNLLLYEIVKDAQKCILKFLYSAQRLS